MPIRFNPYQQRMPSFRRPPPRRSNFNPFTNRGIGGFRGLGGMFGGRGQRRRPPPRGRFPQSFGGFGGRGRGAPPPRRGRGRGRGGMFGGFPQSRGRGRQSPFSNLFGGIGGFGGRRQFNPFMNRFGGGFAPSERRQPQDWDAFLEKIRSGLGSNFGLGEVKADIPALEPHVMGGPDAPAAPPPMETTAPVMPAAPQPLAPAIPEMPLSPDPKYATFEEYMNRPEEDYILEKYQGPVAPTPPTVGPPGTTITPLASALAPKTLEEIKQQEKWTMDDLAILKQAGITHSDMLHDLHQHPTPPQQFMQEIPAEELAPPPTGNQYGPQPLLPSMPGKEPRTPPFIGRGPGAPLPPTLPVNIAQENIEREIIPPQLPVAPIQQQATPNTLRAQEREPGFTGADLLRQNVGLGSPMAPSVNMNEINKRLKKLSELRNTPMQHYSPGGF